MSAVTAVTINTSAAITRDAPESTAPAGAGDDFIVAGGVAVVSTGDDVTLTAGDDVRIDGTVETGATNKTVPVAAGASSASPRDNDGLGALALGAAGFIGGQTVRLSARQDITLAGNILATGVLELNAGTGITQTGGIISAGRL